MRSKRGKRRGQGPGAPLWMVTYSDMVTLLLAFFVLLFSFSKLDVERFQAVMAALQGSLGVLPGGRTVSRQSSMDEASLGLEKALDRTRRELEQMQELYEDFTSLIRENGLADRIEIVREDRGLVVRFSDSIFFDLGQAELKPPSKDLLREISRLLQPIKSQIRLEGHTDNLPINTERFPSNWELSTARATVVLRYLVEHLGFPPERLSAAGYGEYRPVADNSSESGRRKNRRVDLIILRPSFQAGDL